MNPKFLSLLVSSMLWPWLLLAQSQPCDVVSEVTGIRHKRGDNGRWGVLDEQDRLIIPYKYGFTQPLTSDLIKVSNEQRADEKYGIIDRQGKQILPIVYDWLEAVGCQHLQGRKDGVSFLFDAQGKVLYQAAGILEFQLYPAFHQLLVSRVYLDPVHPSQIIRAVLDTRTYKPVVPTSKLVGQPTAHLITTNWIYNKGKPSTKRRLPFFEVRYADGGFNGTQTISRLTDLRGRTLYDSVSSCEYDSERGLVFVLRNRRGYWIVTDTLLRPVKWLSNKYESVTRTGPDDKWWAVRRGGKFGVLDGAGKAILPVKCQAGYLEYVGSNWFRLITERGGNYDYFFVSTKNRVVDLSGYDIETPPPELGKRPFIVIKRSTYKYGIFDLREGFIVPAIYDKAEEADGGIVFFQGENAGYMDRRGHKGLLASQCQMLSAFSNGYAVCGKLLPASRGQFPGAQIIYSTEAYPLAVQYAYMDATSKLVTGYFDWVGPFYGGIASVQKNNEAYMINTKGQKIVVAPGVVLASYFSQGLALVRQGMHYGLINKAGRLVVPPKYRSIVTDQVRQGSMTLYSKKNKGNHLLPITVPKLVKGTVEVEPDKGQNLQLVVGSGK
ncbi:MAG: WG repeat-containing protein [Janthinobacterium lividum]